MLASQPVTASITGRLHSPRAPRAANAAERAPRRGVVKGVTRVAAAQLARLYIEPATGAEAVVDSPS